jgi:acyl carrier protein
MSSEGKHGKEAIFEDMVRILEDMTSDWDTDFEGGITRETRLIEDLGFESIDVVQLIVAIEEHFGRKKMPFERLIMRDGRYVDEIIVGDAVDFLHEELNKPVAA